MNKGEKNQPSPGLSQRNLRLLELQTLIIN